MNYSDPRLQSLLAAEYVLGGLHGPVKRRFEKLLLREPGLRDAVECWQNRLNPLAENAIPVPPREQVWKNIRTAIRNDSPRSGWVKARFNPDFWLGFASAALILTVSYFIVTPNIPVSEMPDYVAVLQDQQARPMMVASMGQGGRTLQIDMLAGDSTGPDRVMQVWCVTRQGGEPMSLGLLTSKQGVFRLSPKQLQQLHQATEILISFEPVGVAPAQQPTGPVMYRGTMI